MEQKIKSKILLIGGEGFIGRSLDTHLADDYQSFSVGEKESLFPGRKSTFIVANPYKKEIDGRYDFVVHLIDNRRCTTEHFLEEENKLIENVSLGDKQHLILFSSAVVYANPESEYGQRKRLLEGFYRRYCGEKGVRLTILRLFNTFGPFQMPYRQGSLVANIISNHIAGKSTEINDQRSERDFLYAGDISKFVEHVLSAKIAGTFDLGSGKLTSIGEIITLLERDVIREPLQIIDKHIPDQIKSPAANNPFLDTIGCTPLSTALTQAVDFYQHNTASVK